jgi:hypothetical protein
LDLIEVPKEEPTDKIAGTVVHLQPEFALIKLNSNRTGLVGTVNGKPAILDGGIPYYGWLGAHLLDAPDFGTIELLGEPIADITKCFSQSSIAICRHFHFAIDDIPILGLSLTLWSCLEPFVKAIPLDKGKLGLELGEYVKIELIIS